MRHESRHEDKVDKSRRAAPRLSRLGTLCGDGRPRLRYSWEVWEIHSHFVGGENKGKVRWR